VVQRGGVIQARARSRIRRSLLAGALCGLFPLAIAPAAQAAVPNGFFGLGGEPIPTTKPSWNRIAKSGARTWKTHLRWAFVERQAPISGVHHYGWGAFDQVVLQAAQVGIRAVPTVHTTPEWANGGCTTCPPLSDAEGHATSEWQSFLTAAVRRYGPGGGFWTQHPELSGDRYKPIVAWQVWQEPNFDFWWNGDASARQYGRFLIDSSVAIKSADPNAYVVFGGLPEVIDGTPMIRFLRNVYRRTPGVKNHFDYAALHPFASDRWRVRYAIKRARRVMRRHGDGDKWIYITEFGWATGGPNVPFRTTLTGQRRKLKRTYRMLVRHRWEWRIARAMWLRYENAGPSGSWGTYTGLFSADGDPKPSWWG